MVENGDVECSRERLRGVWWITLIRNVVENGDEECSRERLREIWWGTVMLGRNA